MSLCFPDLRQFRAWATRGNVVPVSREVLADLDTPLSAFLKIRGDRQAFLLESVEGGERWARFSFLGRFGAREVVADGRCVQIKDGVRIVEEHVGASPLDVLRRELERYRPVDVPGLPRLSAGFVGYMTYDIVRHFERLPDRKPDVLGFPRMHLSRTDSLLVFDNVRGTIRVIRNVFVDEEPDLDAAYERAVAEIEELIRELRAPLPEMESSRTDGSAATPWRSNFTREDYHRAVEKAKEYVQAGDIIQVVPSQRFSTALDVRPIDLYRALRVVNPSPYMFFLGFDEGMLVGSSPELLVRVEGEQVMTRPIAGTRPRAASVAEDDALERDLRGDPKEMAEHVMLVDLGRNDVGRVARAGSVRVPELAVVERYSHVMHLVSHVEGRLREDRDALDALRSAFPAGTLTGAPKIRAMEIIEELEPSHRGPYGGAVGWVSFDGDMDFCITIRTLVLENGEIHVQAGGGVVADSDPEREYRETVNKARAARKAVELARAGLENLSLVEGVPRGSATGEEP